MTQFKTQKFTFFAPRTVIFIKNVHISGFGLLRDWIFMLVGCIDNINR